MSKLHKVEVELTKEEAERVSAIMESGDEAAILAELERLDKAASVRQQATQLRIRLLTDVVRCAHHFSHTGEHDKLGALLCATVGLIDGDTPSLEVLAMLFNMLNENNVQREKDSCEGSA